MIAVCSSFTARNAAQAHRLEIDEDRVPLFRRGIRADAIVPGEHNLNEADGGRRKLSCMAAVHQREGKEDAKEAEVTVRSNFALEPDKNSCFTVSVKQSHNSLCLLHLNLKRTTKPEHQLSVWL